MLMKKRYASHIAGIWRMTLICAEAVSCGCQPIEAATAAWKAEPSGIDAARNTMNPIAGGSEISYSTMWITKASSVARWPWPAPKLN
jgi:hypothetical protein